MTPRRLTAALAVTLVPLVLTACGSTRDPETYRERPTVDAARASVGSLELRDVTIAAPAAGEQELAVGGEATATLYVVNTGSSADRLTGVSSEIATSAELLGPEGQSMPAVDLPARGSVGSGDFSVALHGLTRALRPGQYVPVTLTFEQAGRRTLDVPVGTYLSPAPAPSENPFESTEG